jgi:hypothetical protein
MLLPHHSAPVGTLAPRTWSEHEVNVERTACCPAAARRRLDAFKRADAQVIGIGDAATGETTMMVAQVPQTSRSLVAQDQPRVRLTAAAGIAFVALTICGLMLPGADPSPTEPLENVRAHFADNRTGVLAGVYLQSLGMVCFLALAAGLGGLVRRGGADPLGILGRVMLAGAAGTAAVTLVDNMAAAALAYRVAAQGDAGAVQALFYFYMMVPLSALPAAAFLAAAAVGILRSGLAPRWLGWVALPPVLCILVGAAGLGDLYGPLEIIGYVGGLVPSQLWILVISIVLLVRRDTVTVAAGSDWRAHPAASGGNPKADRQASPSSA